VIVHQCIPRGRKVTTADVLVVVEVVSPGSEYIDTVDKRAEYAGEGIPLYLIVHLDGELRVKIIQEHRLDWSSGGYRLIETHQDALVLKEPFPLSVSFAELDA
jgi:Uma2 family endonuclease